MNPLSFSLRLALAAAACALLFVSTSNPTLAQSTKRQIGTQFEATADPLVPRPNQHPCKVSLFTALQFAHFSDTAQTFQFSPPASCVGPWKKIVFEADFSENGGVQFDRTASMYIANTNIYFGTTPEPLETLTNNWHIERDVTDYAALFSIPQQGTIVLANCTDDCAPPYNTLNGVFTVNADLEFYPADGGSVEPHPADVVLPLEQVNSTGGINLPANVTLPTDQFSTTFTLPTNIERVYLDVISQSQSTDEQWYGCFPNDLSDINEIYGCGNTGFRETEITIDGTPAGISPISPWVYTGFLPDQWIPMPGVQTLDFVAYRVNLTPFAALLNDGNPHTVSLSVFNDDGYFSETASLLLYLDQGSTHVTGAVTSNTLTAPAPVVSENLHGTSTVTGTIGVKSDRHFTIAGFVNTSHGKVSTSVSEHQDFFSTQTIDFDTVNFTVLNQKTSMRTNVSSKTTVSSNRGTVVTDNNFSFPITVDLLLPVDNSLFGLTVATQQDYKSETRLSHNWILTRFRSITDSAKASDATPLQSSQEFTGFNSEGWFYGCHLTSKDNTLTNASQGCKP